MTKIIHSTHSNHTLCVVSIPASAMPNFDSKRGFTHFYEVRNFDAEGVVFLYLAKGNPSAPREICAWYPNGKFWSGFGTTFQSAIDGAQRDGWLYADSVPPRGTVLTGQEADLLLYLLDYVYQTGEQGTVQHPATINWVDKFPPGHPVRLKSMSEVQRLRDKLFGAHEHE